MKMLVAAMLVALAGSTGAALADPIEGQWRMPSGNNATIAPCGNQFCLTYVDGPNAGRTFGRMTPTGGAAYEGTVVDYTRGGREFSGRGTLQGDILNVQGCVLGGLICRSQQLTRS